MDGIYHLFKNNVRQSPDKVAAIYMDTAITYAELDNKVAKLTQYFIQSGITPGQRIAIFLPNSIEFIVAMLAIARLGAAAVPLPVSLKGDTLTTMFIKADVTMVIAWPTISKLLISSQLTAACDVITVGTPVDEEVSWGNLQRAELVEVSDGAIDTHAPYILTMTSGSTGQPKPIILSQACKIRRAKEATIEYYKLTRDDVILVATPLYHSLAQRGILMSLILGATVVVLPKFNLPLWLNAIELYRVTFLFAVSAQLESLANHQSIDSDKLSSLVTLVASSAVLEEATKKQLSCVLGCSIHECYGASEIGVATDFSISDNPSESGSVGWPLPFLSLKIVDTTGQALPPNTIGEICCNTSTAFSGYFDMPEATEEAFDTDGYFKTGDLGYLNESGFLYYTGRRKEVISSGGINVFPQDIESVIRSIDGITDCVAFGTSDPQFGEVVKVVYEQSQGDDLSKAIRQVCMKQLTDYQQPRYLSRTEALPRNPMGKVLRNDVKKMFS